MNKLATLAVTLALAFAGNVAFADDGGGDNSMSQWTGESYMAFKTAPKAAGSVRLSAAEAKNFKASGENSMSRWNGDSYTAFEAARTSPNDVTVSIAEANKARAAANREVPARTASRTRTPANAFRDDTAG